MGGGSVRQTSVLRRIDDMWACARPITIGFIDLPGAGLAGHEVVAVAGDPAAGHAAAHPSPEPAVRLLGEILEIERSSFSDHDVEGARRRVLEELPRYPGRNVEAPLSAGRYRPGPAPRRAAGMGTAALGLRAPAQRSIEHVGSAPSIGRRSISSDLVVDPDEAPAMTAA